MFSSAARPMKEPVAGCIATVHPRPTRTDACYRPYRGIQVNPGFEPQRIAAAPSHRMQHQRHSTRARYARIGFGNHHFKAVSPYSPYVNEPAVDLRPKTGRGPIGRIRSRS